ncbi:MAG: glycyl-radical enzyme activating protein [Acidobacteriota bacterium]|nr:glycyl-radical enzyme activating protein [Acidobacteriota bacterium]
MVAKSASEFLVRFDPNPTPIFWVDAAMEKALTGKVYDIQGFSVQDGPGIRTTVFLKGCPLRCPWCHSPESQQFYAQLSWVAMRCLGMEQCGKCLDVCPKHALSPGRIVRHPTTQADIRHIQINRTLCDNCGECAAVCYPKALYICGTDYTVEELLQRVRKDKPFYDNSGGGVTISGGEPLCQPAFTMQLLQRLKENGIHTALDTTGYVPFETIEGVLPYTDLFLYDLKHMNSEQHKIVVGVSNERILENAQRIAQAGGALQIRIPVIPDFSDTEANIRETGVFCKSLGKALTVIQLLPYHNLGVMKYQRLDDSKIVLEAEPPSDATIRSLKELLEGMGLPVTVH